jgi:hypothetical protein
METDSEGLLSIRCPFEKTYLSKHTGKQRTKVCNRQCVKVKPGSSGEAHCISCDKRFDFEVPAQDSGGNPLVSSQEVHLTG